MELTNQEFLNILDSIMSEPDEDQLLDESYQKFKDSGHDEEDEELWNDEGGEEW